MIAADEELATYLSSRRAMVEGALELRLPSGSTRPEVIHEAMRYSTMAGGKRIRPILAVAAAEAVGAESRPLVGHFAALELIHTYSLVHDDLPAIDNDELRRGRATAHVVFGEAMAILAGDALLTEAFCWLSAPLANVAPERQIRAIQLVAEAVSSRGMIGGQVADIVSERAQEKTADREALLEQLEYIHANKTGKLLKASVLLGGLLGGATPEQLDALEAFGRAAGLAFQIVDDLLDVEETAASLGKTAGKDIAQGKLTFPSLVGREEARRRLDLLLVEAVDQAARVGGGVNYLAAIARYICERRH